MKVIIRAITDIHGTEHNSLQPSHVRRAQLIFHLRQRRLVYCHVNLLPVPRQKQPPLTPMVQQPVLTAPHSLRALA